MRIIKSCIAMIAVLCTFLFVTGCGKTEVSFNGQVKVEPSKARVGDEVVFKVGKVGDDINVVDENVVNSVVYYIDGNEIGESLDRESGYAVRYKVSGLTVGVYTISARCKSKNVDFKERITPGTLTIEE